MEKPTTIDKPTTVQPQIGTWANLPTEEVDRKPKVEFDINIAKDLVFMTNEPREYQGDNGAYYIFDVEENKQPKVVMTSAWSLLRALKLIGELEGKRLQITKKMEKGKQFFEVNEVKNKVL